MTTKTLLQIASLLVLALIFIQCSKSDEITTTKPNQPQLSAFDKKIHNMVKDFKTKMNSDLKSGEIMSTDSAIWYISTTINATYGNPANGDFSPQNTYIDTISTDLSAYNGSISIEEVNNLYTELLDSLRTIYYGIAEEDKQFGALIYNYQSTGFKSSNSGASVNWIIITYSTWGLNSWELFEPGETYYFDDKDDYGNSVNPNACSKLQDKFFSHIIGDPNIAPYPGYYWIPNEGHQVDAQDFAYNFNGGNFTNFLDYYLFFNSNIFPGFHTTLFATEMNFHLTKIIELAEEILPVGYNIAISENYRCFQIFVDGNKCYTGNPPILSCAQHTVYFVYGYRVANIIPPEEL